MKRSIWAPRSASFNSLLGEEQTYTIVGSAEVEPLELKVSDESPIGKALSGAKVGDVVEVNTPNGKDIYPRDPRNQYLR